MPDAMRARVSDDLDALRRSLDADDELSPHLARFLAACTGTLHAADQAARRDELAR